MEHHTDSLSTFSRYAVRSPPEMGPATLVPSANNDGTVWVSRGAVMSVEGIDKVDQHAALRRASADSEERCDPNLTL